MRLLDRIAIVTGAGSGIGQATAIRFAQEGAKVLCVDRDGDSGERTAAMIRKSAGTAKAFEADVGKADDTQVMAKVAVDSFGGIDVLVNNAGGTLGVRGPVHLMAEEDWDRAVGNVLKTVFLASKAVLPYMLERGKGSIVNIGSTFSVIAAPEIPAYCAAKGGVLMLTKQMAIDYGPNIRVNCVCPGSTDTPQVRRNINNAPDPIAREQGLREVNRIAGRLARPEEIASAALFLASDDSSFVMGVMLPVDGGQTTYGPGDTAR